MTVVVNISDTKVASDASAVLATYSLGSCIAVSMYDPVMRVGGMLHYQLPTSTLDPERAQQNPSMFADTGVAYLLRKLIELGAEIKRLKVKLAGGALILDHAGVFNIARRNHTAIRKILWQHGLLIDGEDIGGVLPRNVFLNISTGAVVSESGNSNVTV